MSSFSYRQIVFLSFLLSISQYSSGQPLREVLKIAETNYPLLKAKRYEVQARIQNVATVKSTALPTLDASYQASYATYNNITGMSYGQFIVPISGPPSATNNYSGVFGSAASLLMNWDLFTFGQRSSGIESAKTFQKLQEADATYETFRHQVRTANAYLDVMLTGELLKVYQKNLARSKDNLRIAKSLTLSGLRPASDTTWFAAELSKAKIELLNLEKEKATALLLLSQCLGGTPVTVADSSFFKTLPLSNVTDTLAFHPLVRLSETKLQIRTQEQKTLQKTLYPKLSMWGVAYARGSGIRYDGYVNTSDGLSFSRYNYGAGLTLSVPLLKFVNVSHQLQAQHSLIKAEEENLTLTKLELSKQNELADMTLISAIKIAGEIPAFYNAAEFSYRSQRSKYNSGLTNYIDFLQAQYLFIKSEADLKRAYIDAWKSLLFKAATQGDINIFLNQIN